MPTAPFKVKAVYEYKSAEPDDLNFPNGQIITVTEEEDDDWYSGNYVNPSGDRLEGLFPRNFVEKYEPAIPSRPVRARPRAEASQPVEAVMPTIAPQDAADVAKSKQSTETTQEAEIQTPTASSPPSQSQPPLQNQVQPQSPIVASSDAPSSNSASKQASGKPPPPIAEKPNTGSFRDRIAAFNKGAAAPVTPFKPATQNNSSGFIRKPFVAPPPSKNSYVPPPREQPSQKIYRREEDPDLAREEAPSERAVEPLNTDADVDEDIPKPTSLKDRIALLQKQQLEQAARHADSVQKKEKPKRPPKKRAESTEALEPAETGATTGGSLERVNTSETVGKKSVDFADDEAGPLRGATNRHTSGDRMATPPPPSRELVSDTNDADDSGAGDTEDAQETSTEDDRPRSKQAASSGHIPGAFSTEPEEDAHDHEGPAEEDGEAEEDTDEDPEIRRRREIRDRMAKMSGGMGMMGMFGPPGGMSGASSSRKSKSATESDRQISREQKQEDTMARAPPVPLMAMPGMTRSQVSQGIPAEPDSEEEGTEQRTSQGFNEDDDAFAPPKRTSTDRSAPSVTQEHGVPPPIREARAAPPPPPVEMPGPARMQSSEFASAPPPPPRATRPVPVEEDLPNARPQSQDGPPSSPPPPPSRSRPVADPPQLETSAPAMNEKRTSRGPPPIPMSPTAASPQTRAPPPPPPGQPPSRRSTMDSRSSSSKHQIENDSEDEITEYDGDYDTDIASSAKHKDALKSHDRDSSLDEGIMTDDPAAKSPTSAPVRSVPSIPVTSGPRDVPPPPPPPSAPKSRKSLDAPRAAPPPVPPPKEAMGEEEYDPYRYIPSNQSMTSPPSKSGYAPVLASPAEEMEQDDMYDPTPTATRSMQPAPNDRIPPPLPYSAAAPMMSGAVPAIISDPSRPSQDLKRSSTQTRRSMEQSRPSGEHSIVASDIDLGQTSSWWTHDNTPPPALQNRNDVLYEIETSTSTKRGGKATTSRDVYVLYMDYSQSTINATFDPAEPMHANLEQRHERPPPPPRKDQLETASTTFGARIAEAAASRLNTTVGDGSAQGLILELLRPISNQALMPVGTRAYGALVYANLANTSTQVFDEIRAGDIVTFRNAKFSGHRGGLHSKYSMDVGMGGKEHVGVVMEWDGTKKKIRAWEQGREEVGEKGKSGVKKGKVKEESFKVGDLRSGEVRVWRVMGRGYVGWDSSSGK